MQRKPCKQGENPHLSHSNNILLHSSKIMDRLLVSTLPRTLVLHLRDPSQATVVQAPTLLVALVDLIRECTLLALRKEDLLQANHSPGCLPSRKLRL